jgi:hypothetical protein
MKTVDQYIEMLQYCLPYDNNDIVKAIEFGRQLALLEVKSKLTGMVVNGTVKGVVTEEQLEKL